jgi:hypothetical protein
VIISLWLILAALVAGAIAAVLDWNIELRQRKLGREVFGVLVLAGLLILYLRVVRDGTLPLPGYGIVFFAILYLPFLSSSFIDLDTTDRVAQRELERLLLETDFSNLHRAFGQEILSEGRRRFRIHWEGRRDDDGVMIELDVHPSTWPITISRPHVALVHSPLHLQRIREDIRRIRGGEGSAPVG